MLKNRNFTSFLVFSYLAILASCFKIVLAKLELHLPKLIAAKFDRLENYDFLTFTFLPCPPKPN
jgi:hypothetical protein